MRPAPRAALGLLLLPLTASAVVAQGLGPSTGGAVALEHERRMLGHHKRVLMIGAHPDDEDTEVLTILVRGHGAEAAYLSLTRGEGGQNLIGSELGEGLGLVRTGELLAARELDGARQFFTRAFDYGFSKSIEEAWHFWPRDSVLKDVVRIIRRFRPQVLVAVFSGTPRDGHGHHQAAGWAATEAFRVAGDPAVFPELASEEGLLPHAPAKLYRGARFDPDAPGAVLDGGVLDRAVGQSFRQVAMRSRSQHRSQDMGALQEVGPSTSRLTLVADRTGQGEELWAGIDTTARQDDADQARRRDRVRAIESGLVLDAIASDDRLVAGQEVTLRLSAWNAGDGPLEVRPRLAIPDLESWDPRSGCLDRPVRVPPGTVSHCQVVVRVPSTFRPSVPYFLAQPRVGAMYQWAGEPAVWGEPFESPPLRAAFDVMTPAGDRLTLIHEATARFRDQAFGEVRRPVQVVPRVGIQVTPSAAVWPLAGGPQEVTVTLQHGAPDTTRGQVSLSLPAGWPAVPPQEFLLDRPDEVVRLTFAMTLPPGLRQGQQVIAAVARTDRGAVFHQGVEAIDYPHIAPRLLPRRAEVVVALADVRSPATGTIGYIRGAADRVPEVLRGIGVPLELLDRAGLERGGLARFAVIVVGSRAYETDTALVEQHPRLLDWVRAGGRLLVQYQQQAYFGGGFAPHPMALAPRGHDRVTDEGSPVVVLNPAATLWHAPNWITAQDWEGWVQERGLYFPRTWGTAWTPMLEMQDPGEEPLRGAILAARLGRGTYIYTGLSFFRQLPAAVPGALRLFLNLLGYDHPSPTE